MGTKLLWTGLFLFLVLPKVVSYPELAVAATIIMALGLVLLWLDR